MTKNHSDSKRGNTLSPLRGLLFPFNSKISFIYALSHRQDSTYHGKEHIIHNGTYSTEFSIVLNEWLFLSLFVCLFIIISKLIV